MESVNLHLNYLPDYFGPSKDHQIESIILAMTKSLSLFLYPIHNIDKKTPAYGGEVWQRHRRWSVLNFCTRSVDEHFFMVYGIIWSQLHFTVASLIFSLNSKVMFTNLSWCKAKHAFFRVVTFTPELGLKLVRCNLVCHLANAFCSSTFY